MEKLTFSYMKNGYNRYQVDDYVDKCKMELDAMANTLHIKEKMIEDLNHQLEESKKAYNTMIETLDIKERAANEMARIAMKEANMIVETAQNNADTIIKESLMMARGILNEIARVANEANEMKGSMKEELQQLMDALDEFETPKIPNMDLLKKQ